MIVFEEFYGNKVNVSRSSTERDNILLLKQLIETVEEMVKKAEVEKEDCYEGICYRFAKLVVNYCKMAYDNLLLGHFDIVKMLLRVILENMLSLDIIITYKEMEIWKFYYMHSMWNRYWKSDKKLVTRATINEMCTNFNIKSNELQKYLKFKYGWTYLLYTEPEKQKYTFRSMCDLDLTEDVYKTYAEYSEYAHGISIFNKTSNTSKDIMDCVLPIYNIAIKPLYNIYGNEETKEKFCELENKLEVYIDSYVLEMTLEIIDDDTI